MSALLILNYDVHDPSALEEYRAAATPALLGEGRGVLLSSTAETEDLPEGAPSGTHTVVLQFDSVETARSVYESAEYQGVIGGRLEATHPRVALIVPLGPPIDHGGGGPAGADG